MSEGPNPLAVRRRLEERYRQLAAARQVRPAAAIITRFNEIDGSTLGILVSVQLFTTVIPLIIMGFSYLTGFADNASPGTVFSRALGLVAPLTDHVRDAFGHSSGLRSSWTFVGVAGFLIWVIPMGTTIAGVFAKAWRREQFGLVGKVWRGVAWFALYLAMIGFRERIAFGGDHHGLLRVVRFVASLIPVWIFWSLTPMLLVRDGGRGRKYVVLAGLAGVVIDGTIIPIAARIVFPRLLNGWDELGPIGVAMALLTWCGVIGTAWVVTACVGAVLWERSAPSQTVIESQEDDLT
ncbi:hypothetical protein [Mycolicibacterium komossense]|uniref:Uncharacterized protein n=1 Tax=Mycolicibacterium komossense TaxID=1779 RepID=A0ABT3CB02_9MYCO|nr:hypothetical protein [Mycolicibacterium komossense]MCV7226655.1 hypothetical protein [Mycolicibacterium komossense]